MFEKLDVRRCGQILISDALGALREVNPDLETNTRVQAIIDSMGGEGETVDPTQFSEFIKALEGVNWRQSSKKENKYKAFFLYDHVIYLKVLISDADIKKVFRIVDVDKSGCISRTVRR